MLSFLVEEDRMVLTSDDIVRPEQFQGEQEPYKPKGAEITERLMAERQKAGQGAASESVHAEGRVPLGNSAMDRMIENRRAEQDNFAREASRREEEADGRRSLPDDRSRKSGGRRQVPRKARGPRR